jgi:hypothetical protein
LFSSYGKHQKKLAFVFLCEREEKKKKVKESMGPLNWSKEEERAMATNVATFFSSI